MFINCVTDTFHPDLVHTRRTLVNNVSNDSSLDFGSSVQETVTLPDQALVFLNSPTNCSTICLRGYRLRLFCGKRVGVPEMAGSDLRGW